MVLHDRRVPRSRANIDHFVVTRAGVWVVDAKHYRDKRPRLHVEGGLFRPRSEKLIVGSDRTKLVESVLRQVALVRDVVGPVDVHGTLCFVDADWPLFGQLVHRRGVEVCWPKRLAKQLARSRGRSTSPRSRPRSPHTSCPPEPRCDRSSVATTRRC